MIKFLQKNKNIKSFLIILFICLLSFSVGNFSYATYSLKSATVSIVGNVILIFVSVCGYILKLIISSIITIGKYNNFIHEGAIIEAWKIIRDFCNMFFIMILLVIAFATILRREDYNMKKMVPKLLLMAVLINFSRMFCGLLIDASQLFFLTFVKTFRSNGSDFVAVNQVQSFLKLSIDKAGFFSEGEPVKLISTVAGMILGLIFLIISTIVLSAILVVIVVRVVMFWIYTVLSPLAFFLSSFPGGQKYASQYWGEFTKYLINGPVLAFFVWLALVAGNINPIKFAADPKTKIALDGAGSILDPSIFLSFLMAIGMLAGGLMISAQIGGVGASWGQNMVGKLKGKAIGLAKAGAGKFSGYNYARDVGKNYMAMRKSARDDRVRLASEKLSKGTGAIKKKLIGDPANFISKQFNDRLWGKFGKNKADELENEIIIEKENFSSYQNKVKNKKSFEHFDTVSGKLNHYDHNGTNWTKDGTIVDEDDIYGNLEASFDHSIKGKRKEIKKAKETQGKMDKIAKYGLGGAAALIAGSTGGLGVGALTFIAASFGAPKVVDKFKNAGKQDLGAASNFNLKQVNDKKEKMKDDSNEKVLSTMNDMTKSSYERVAAAMEAMTRKIVDLNDAKYQSEIIRETFKSDKKVNGQLDSILEKNYLGATSLFENLKDMSSDKGKKAHREIRAGYEDGSYLMKNMDAKTIKASIKEAALGVSTPNFVRQYKDFDAAKQATVLRSLKGVTGHGEYEAKEKIAHIKDINIAFKGDTVMKDKFVNKLTAADLKKIIEEGNKEKLQALKDHIKDINQLSESAKTVILSTNSPVGRTIKDTFKV